MRSEGRRRVCPNYSPLKSTQRLGISASPQSSPCPTPLLNGALTALRCARRTDKRPQLHHRLIELPRFLSISRYEEPGEVPDHPGRGAGGVGRWPARILCTPHAPPPTPPVPEEPPPNPPRHRRIHPRHRALARE